MKQPKVLTIGFLINPIAGMGGKVGLKGTDGSSILAEALRRGATPVTPMRAKRFLKELENCPSINKIHFIVAPEPMGGQLFSRTKFSYEIISDYRITKEKTTATETIELAKIMAGIPVDLLVFFGGDGTARDIVSVVGDKQLILGVPSGVKIHSGVFARSIEDASMMICGLVKNGNIEATEGEIIDLDEESFRENKIITKLYSIAKIPLAPQFVQLAKTSLPVRDDEIDNLKGIKRTLEDEYNPSTLYILGSGSTIQKISPAFGITPEEKTLLGIDVVLNKKIIAKDVNEKKLLQIINTRDDLVNAKIIVTPIGRQGFIFGRGNQQLSSEVLKRVGLENILIITTKAKLSTLPSNCLYVDTGEKELDQQFRGYWKVLIDYEEYRMMKVC